MDLALVLLIYCSEVFYGLLDAKSMFYTSDPKRNHKGSVFLFKEGGGKTVHVPMPGPEDDSHSSVGLTL